MIIVNSGEIAMKLPIQMLKLTVDASLLQLKKECLFVTQVLEIQINFAPLYLEAHGHALIICVFANHRK
jgi:hypothetical protein